MRQRNSRAGIVREMGEGVGKAEANQPVLAVILSHPLSHPFSAAGSASTAP